VTDKTIEKFTSTGYDEDFLIYKLKVHFKKNKNVISLIFFKCVLRGESYII